MSQKWCFMDKTLKEHLQNRLGIKARDRVFKDDSEPYPSVVLGVLKENFTLDYQVEPSKINNSLKEINTRVTDYYLSQGYISRDFPRDPLTGANGGIGYPLEMYKRKNYLFIKEPEVIVVGVSVLSKEILCSVLGIKNLEEFLN
jgi:hypothetical protein